MSLTLHFHPLSSFCWKALIALYENDIPFTPNSVNLGDPAERAALPSLFYGNMVEPSGDNKNVTAYFERLKARPSVARVMKEAEPYFGIVPK